MMLRQPRTSQQEESTAQAIQEAIKTAKAQRPSDRTELDRAYAVTITQLEQAFAYFCMYAISLPAALAQQAPPEPE